MGCSLSSRSSSSTTHSNVIRVVHLNGFVEDYGYPVTVCELTGTGSPQKQFVCTPHQLTSVDCSSSKLALQPDAILEAGHIYFLLPYSTLQTDVSPVALASIAKKLIAKAKSTSTKSKANNYYKSCSGTNTLWSTDSGAGAGAGGIVSCRAQRFSRMRPWKPILDTIREKSFNRRSESNLQET